MEQQLQMKVLLEGCYNVRDRGQCFIALRRDQDE